MLQQYETDKVDQIYPEMASGQVLQMVDSIRTEKGSKGLLASVHGGNVHLLYFLVNIVHCMLKNFR